MQIHSHNTYLAFSISFMFNISTANRKGMFKHKHTHTYLRCSCHQIWEHLSRWIPGCTSLQQRKKQYKILSLYICCCYFHVETNIMTEPVQLLLHQSRIIVCWKNLNPIKISSEYLHIFRLQSVSVHFILFVATQLPALLCRGSSHSNWSLIGI